MAKTKQTARSATGGGISLGDWDTVLPPGETPVELVNQNAQAKTSTKPAAGKRKAEMAQALEQPSNKRHRSSGWSQQGL